MLERPHLDLADQLLPLLGLVVELRQHLPQQVPDQARLVVRRAVEGDQRHSPHVEVRVPAYCISEFWKWCNWSPECGEEVADLGPEQLVDRLRLVRDGELHGGDHGGPHQGGGRGQGGLQLRRQLRRGHQAQLAEALGHYVPGCKLYL